MGNACCVAARDKMVLVVPPNSSAAETERRRPWSFRWDNNNNNNNNRGGGGGRVAGEDSSLTWLSDGISRNDGSDFKFESPFVSSHGSPPSLHSFQTQTLLKSPVADLSFPRCSSMNTVFEQKENVSTEAAPPSYPPPPRLSLSLASQPSSFPPSPLPSHPASSSTLQLTQSPRLSKQLSDGQIYGINSLSRSSPTEERLGTPFRYDSSQSRPSEGWSQQAFSEMMSSSRCNEPLSYDNGCFGLERDKIDHHSNRMSNHQKQTCGACARPLSEKSLWSSQNIFMTNELSVSAFLACGHVYHGECLEQMTPEIDKFDPSCPICTLGEKKTAMLSEKALKVEMNLKAKRLRNRVLDSDFECNDFVMFDQSHMASAAESPKLVSSSSVKSYSAKPFLARHFSFGSRGNSKSTKDDLPVRKKGFFWTKSIKI
ncbi:PREDICTED: probable serine/threonine-protein kinase DDB_G0278665 isoform X2 [Brassica oleracea var. oleracea]|uniref:probable serine/threonine-protein kinase DDB_G0278665 isoform X2 n=1 Tax=Brassica oleracea var. oleracea TaxID=109376 RepID=UPI0006A70567|nr:PREDICTED: probable serine/threonine-protein kinase DDB_G0278665 isoform X2 [Brassica oleracea var. oleracea]